VPSLTTFIKASNNDRIYKIENGHKRWVTSRASFNANGGDWNKITTVSQGYLVTIPNGANL
jgi:hypothetical protein